MGINKTCPRCRRISPVMAQFCPQCGMAFDWSGQAVATAQPPMGYGGRRSGRGWFGTAVLLVAGLFMVMFFLAHIRMTPAPYPTVNVTPPQMVNVSPQAGGWQNIGGVQVPIEVIEEARTHDVDYYDRVTGGHVHLGPNVVTQPGRGYPGDTHGSYHR